MTIKTSRLRPSVVIWWGVAVTVLGALLVIFVPNFVTSMTTGQSGLPTDFESIFEITARAIAMIFPNLGTVLIGAGIVMLYVDRQRDHVGHE